MGADHDGLCDSLATNIAEARCGMGYYGPTYQVGTFSGCADDLHTGGILQVVCSGDSPVTWSASFHSIRSGSPVHDSLLEEFPEGHGNTVDNEHHFYP